MSLTLETQPDDHIRHICSFLNYKDIMNLQDVSTRFSKVVDYISHIVVDKLLNTNEERTLLVRAVRLSKKLHTLDMSNIFYMFDLIDHQKI